jgi:hypothetical protein
MLKAAIEKAIIEKAVIEDASARAYGGDQAGSPAPS